jgi:hypothetical protein
MNKQELLYYQISSRKARLVEEKAKPNKNWKTILFLAKDLESFELHKNEN